MRDIMFEESAADLEGGNLDDEDLNDLINPQRPPQKVRSQAFLLSASFSFSSC